MGASGAVDKTIALARAASADGQTPLHVAAAAGHIRAVKMLQFAAETAASGEGDVRTALYFAQVGPGQGQGRGQGG